MQSGLTENDENGILFYALLKYLNSSCAPNPCNLGEVLDQMEMIPFANNQRNSKMQKGLENLGKLLFGNQFVFWALPAQGGGGLI